MSQKEIFYPISCEVVAHDRKYWVEELKPITIGRFRIPRYSVGKIQERSGKVFHIMTVPGLLPHQAVDLAISNGGKLLRRIGHRVRNARSQKQTL